VKREYVTTNSRVNRFCDSPGERWFEYAKSTTFPTVDSSAGRYGRLNISLEGLINGIVILCIGRAETSAALVVFSSHFLFALWKLFSGLPASGMLVDRYGGFLQVSILSGVMCLTGGYTALVSKAATPQSILGKA